MTGPSRISAVASLPPHGEWRRVLALDRAAGAPRPVVLTLAPASVMDDPARLAAVVRDAEAAGRLHHPGAIAVLGTDTIDDTLVVVEAFRPGESVRALLDAAGRLPPDVAARVVLDVCEALSRAHAIDAGDGQPLVHGAVAPTRVVVGDDGTCCLAGFGVSGGGTPGDDVRALAGLLHECLAGEPAPAGSPSLDVPGIPAPVAEVVSRALRDDPAPSAAAFAHALAAAAPVASHADVAAYATAVLPGKSDPAALAGALAGEELDAPEEVDEDLIVEPTGPVATPRTAPAVEPTGPVATPRIAPAVVAAGPVAPLAPPAETAPAVAPVPRAQRQPPPHARELQPEPLPRPPATRPGIDPAGVFAAPAPPARRSAVPLVVGAVCGALGFGGGFFFARAELAPGALASGGAAPPAAEAPAPEAARDAVAPGGATPAPARDERVRAPAPKPAAVRRAPPARSAARPAAPVARGVLDVTAPEGADVYLDGRKIGVGNVRREIPVGAHRVEVRLGAARVSERFEVAQGETWTYEVTPTP